MTMNVGSADKIIRIVIGLGLIGYGIIAKSWWGAIGIVPLSTALLNYCPLYSICGANTCSTKPSK